MEQNALTGQLYDMLGIVLYMALPPLIAAVVIGLLVGVMQAVTQIQDQSLPLAFKLIIVMAVLALAGPVLSVPLVREATSVFDNFSLMTR